MTKPIVLCIPRANTSITEQQVRKTFNDLNLGELERIDIRNGITAKGDKFNKIFIHYKIWNNSENAQIAKERLSDNKNIKVIYDSPWYWKVVAYKEPEKLKKPLL